MNNPDHTSERLETFFWAVIQDGKIRIWDPGSRMEKIRIRGKHPGSAILVKRRANSHLYIYTFIPMSKENYKFEIYVFFCSSENLAKTLPHFGNAADFFTQSLQLPYELRNRSFSQLATTRINCP
jgi:hypothetical protein